MQSRLLFMALILPCPGSMRMSAVIKFSSSAGNWQSRSGPRNLDINFTWPKVFSALPTPNQRKTCKKYTFLTKKIMQIFFFTSLPTPYFFQTVTGNKQYFFLGLAYWSCFLLTLRLSVAGSSPSSVAISARSWEPSSVLTANTNNVNQ